MNILSHVQPEVQPTAVLNTPNSIEASIGSSSLTGIEALEWLAAAGCSFTHCPKADKRPFHTGWQNRPFDLESTIAHVSGGGNVGILTGAHSSNIILLDCDVNFPTVVQLLESWGETAKVVRRDAPERGKFIYRIDGELPKTTAWKATRSDRHPSAELLADGRHGLVAPSINASGAAYEIIDSQYGIKTLTTQQMSFVWMLVTGESETQTASHTSQTDGLVAEVKKRWSCMGVFEHFGLTTGGVKTERGGDTRILSHGGLLVSEAKEQWYCHAEAVGGDAIDAWAWCKNGSIVDRRSPKSFIETVDEMAAVGGVGRQTRTVGFSSGAASKMASTLSELGYRFSLNTLENEIYVENQLLAQNNRLLGDVELAEIRFSLTDLGFTSLARLDDVILHSAAQSSFNPIVDYFKTAAAEWDGHDHFADLMRYITFDQKMVAYGDGTKADLNVAVFRKWMLGLIVQVMAASSDDNPIRFQNPMLVFAGGQEAGKSSLARWICPINPSDYHIESSLDPHNVEHQRLTVSHLVWEVTELGGTMRRADKDSLKAFLTAAKSTYRTPWGKKPITRNRIVSYVGTINPETGFLNDVTGERRYSPVNVESIDWSYATEVDQHQLWAQMSAEYFASSEPLKLATYTAEERAVLSEQRSDHKIDNPLVTVFQRIFDIDPAMTDERMHTADIIAAFERSEHSAPGMLPPDLRYAASKVAECLMTMGLGAAKNVKIDGVQGRGYVGIKPKRSGTTRL